MQSLYFNFSRISYGLLTGIFHVLQIKYWYLIVHATFAINFCKTHFRVANYKHVAPICFILLLFITNLFWGDLGHDQ